MSNLSLDQLKARIEKNKELKSKENVDSPLSLFIENYTIRKGFDKIPNYVILYLYVLFLEKNKEIYPYKTIDFHKKLSKQLNKTRTGKMRYYLIDKTLLSNLPHDLEFKALLWNKTK